MIHETLGGLVARHPEWSPVFDRLGLDYCCHGHEALGEAARQKGLDPDTIARLLEALPEALGTTNATPNPAQLPTPDLIDHIVATHHAYLRRELPQLVWKAGKVAQAHGTLHPAMATLHDEVRALAHELLTHLDDEERDLFPELLTGREPDQSIDYRADHDQAGAALVRIHGLTDDLRAPAWACATVRGLYEGLAALEDDLHRHIHLENSVLLPRFGR